MFNPLSDHDSNSYKDFNEANDLDKIFTSYETMSLKELNACVDAEILEETLAEILSMPSELRFNAIADFEEIDPDLGAKLRLEVLFASH